MFLYELIFVLILGQSLIVTLTLLVFVNHIFLLIFIFSLLFYLLILNSHRYGTTETWMGTIFQRTYDKKQWMDLKGQVSNLFFFWLFAANFEV